MCVCLVSYHDAAAKTSLIRSGKQPHSEQLTVISYIQFPTQTISTSQILLFIFAAGSSDGVAALPRYFLKPIRKKDKIPKDAAVAVVRAMALCPEPIFPL